MNHPGSAYESQRGPEDAPFPGPSPAGGASRPGGAEDSEMLLRKAFETGASQGIELLFRWYYRPLCSHAIRYVSSREIAEDIVSDVFYRFHTEQVFNAVETSFRAYLFTAVRHRAFDFVRLEMMRNVSLEQAGQLAEQSHQRPDQIAQYEELYRLVEDAVNSLPPKRRRIYVMHRFEGRKYQEIASELNLSLRTVEAQMYGAIHEVRKIIRARWVF